MKILENEESRSLRVDPFLYIIDDGFFSILIGIDSYCPISHHDGVWLKTKTQTNTTDFSEPMGEKI